MLSFKTFFPGFAVPIFILFCFLFVLPVASMARVDKWGGDDRLKNPSSKYQTGNVSDISDFSLTDKSKHWKKNELTGCILQPNINREIYFLVKGNTRDAVTVYGSMNKSSEEATFKSLRNFSHTGDKYALLDNWKVLRIDKRWGLFDPFGNFFIIKSVNGFNYEHHRYGTDARGISLVDNLKRKHDTKDPYSAFIAELGLLKSFGFNTLGEIVDVYRTVPGHAVNSSLTPDKYMPFIAQVRINSLALQNVSKFSVNGQQMWDATDPRFQAEMESRLSTDSGAKTDGIKPFTHKFWGEWMLTPYLNSKYNIAANPWYIGLDWDEEPAYLRSESNNEHLGYRILTSDGISFRKQRALSLLIGKYSTIKNLNSSWRTDYMNWDDLKNDTGGNGINRALSSEPYVRSNGPQAEKNTAMKEDLDGIAADFWREYCRKVHDALDNVIAVHKVNFGPGYHGWIGSIDKDGKWSGLMTPAYYFYGSVSRERPYIDVIGIGDPMHGPHENANNIFENMRGDLQTIYKVVGRPFWHESCWITAEADSGVTHAGSVDAVAKDSFGAKNANFYTELHGNKVYYGVSSRLWVLFNPYSTTARERRYYAISKAGKDTLDVDVELGPGNSWRWNRSFDLRKIVSPGSKFVIVANDVIPHIRTGSKYSLYIPLSQKERAAFYVKFLDELINLKGLNGDFMDVGYSHWQFYDFGFRNQVAEHRNWGFASVRGHLYDGKEASKYNGELRDFGDFVNPVIHFLNKLYDIAIKH